MSKAQYEVREPMRYTGASEQGKRTRFYRVMQNGKCVDTFLTKQAANRRVRKLAKGRVQ